MRQTFRLAVGAALVGATLPDGSPAYAVQVDNPGGSWLVVYPGAGTCPPFTQGFVAAFPGGATVVDVRSMPTGPAGQVSTGSGDPATVTLYDADEAPPASEGVPFVVGFVPTRRAAVTIPPTGLVAFSVGFAGQRIRVLTFGAAIVMDSQLSDSPISLTLLDNPLVLGTYDALALSNESPSAFHAFPGGLDFGVGVGVQTQASWVYAQRHVFAFITYLLI